jgi:hypothetical protein
VVLLKSSRGGRANFEVDSLLQESKLKNEGDLQLRQATSFLLTPGGESEVTTGAIVSCFMDCVHLNRMVVFASCPVHQGATQNEGIVTVKEAAQMLDVALSNFRVWGAAEAITECRNSTLIAG